MAGKVEDADLYPTPAVIPANAANSAGSASAARLQVSSRLLREPVRRAQTSYRSSQPVYTRKKKHPVISALIALTALALISVSVYFGAPMLISGNARYVFANGYILERDDNRLAQFAYDTQIAQPYFSSDAILPGVFIDGIHVGGMTVEEARTALGQSDALSDEHFKVTVSIGNKSWVIDASHVPLKKNTEAVLESAHAYGRQVVFGAGTPYAQRLQNARELREDAGHVYMRTEAVYDKEAVRVLTDEIADFVNRPARNAQVTGFDFVRKTFSFSDEASGARVDPEQLFMEVTGKLDKRERNAALVYIPEEVLPQVRKADLVNEFRLLSSYTTKTTSNANRNTNVRLSAQAINGREVKPGEVFSFNETVGQRTVDKGYKEAIAIAGGQNVPDIGGGVCQTSGTLFNAVARADLEIVYRSPHAWPSTYVEKGMDATVNWPNLDFKFKNNKDTPVYIAAYYADRLITVEVYGQSLGTGISIDLESETIRTMKPPNDIRYVNNASLSPGTSRETIQPRTGYEVNTYKIWYQDGREIHRELFCQSTYKMYQRTVEYN
jgi:vancomycin resistance protein YoaR